MAGIAASVKYQKYVLSVFVLCRGAAAAVLSSTRQKPPPVELKRVLWTQSRHPHQQQLQQRLQLRPQEKPAAEPERLKTPRQQQQQQQQPSSPPLPPLSPPGHYQQQQQQDEEVQAPSLSLPDPEVVTVDVEGLPLGLLASPCPGPRPRALAVLIGWLNAKPRHLVKFQQLYWRRGMDVLTMDVAPLHVVRPQAGIRYTARLLALLQEHEMLRDRQLVFHGFSIGAFMYTQLQKMLQEESRRQGGDEAELGRRIAGLVLDSPAYMDHMCVGIANSLTAAPLLQAAIRRGLELYLAAFPRSVTFHYQESHRIFHENRVPTLLLYSPRDLVSSAAVSERYAAEWRDRGLSRVFAHSFPDSAHVSHLRHYPQAYAAALDRFLDQLDLPLVGRAAGVEGIVVGGRLGEGVTVEARHSASPVTTPASAVAHVQS